MRILQIAPVIESVPPKGYGGTEAVVHLLCEELVRQGHEVTLWASGDSQTSADLEHCVPRSLRTDDDCGDKMPYIWQHASSALRTARTFDVVHNHAGEEVMSLAQLIDTPMLNTMHCNIATDRQFIWDNYDGFYNTISWSQHRAMPEMTRPRFAGVAYNGIDVESFPFEDEKDDYLLFISRIAREKGVHLAVEAAKRAGRRLLIAGKVDVVDQAYFEAEVAPLIDDKQTVFLGEANAVMKRALYKKAYAVLMPLQWEEPFGLVMAEAGACGTPVIAFNRGSAPEVIRQGKSGFVVDTMDEMVDSIERLNDISPHDCRRWVEDQFGAAQMGSRYVEIYEALLAGAGHPSRTAREIRLTTTIGSENGHREAVTSDRVA